MELSTTITLADHQSEACAIVNAFDGRSRCTVPAGAIGSLGCDVFAALARQGSALVRPVPFRRDELCRIVICSKRSLSQALARLVEYGFLALSGTRIAPMAMLHLPAGAVEAYRQEEEEWTAQAKRLGFGNPTFLRNLGASLELLDMNRAVSPAA